MHHPGPPRFTTVGDTLELAPRAPNPDETFRWHVADSPDDSGLSLGDDPVETFAPDAPGRYTVALDAPDGRHEQTIRVFPDERRPARFELADDDLPIPKADVDCISVMGPFNDHLLGRDRPVREEGGYVHETELPPGDHPYAFVVDDDMDQQVFGSLTVPGPGRPRIRLDATVEGVGEGERGGESEGEDEGVGESEAAVVTATARAPSDSEDDDEDLSVEFYLDDRDDATLSVDGRQARVPLAELGDDELARVHAVAVGERHSVADVVSVAGDGTVSRPNDPPEWAEHPTIYEIFVREFAGPTLDTTFDELRRRVPYLESLGVDAVWLTPVLASPTRHGYHITDYFDTAADLGSRESFEAFVDRCHDADIRVVFDLVINHSSRDHPAFQQSAAGVEAYRDWYVWKDRRAGEYERYFNWKRIPNFDYGSLAVRQFCLDVIDEWVPVVDGFRCDVAWGVPHGFWKEVRERVPDDFLLLDETLPHDPAYHEAEFDMHYDTSLYETLREVGRGEAPASEVVSAAREHERLGFPDSAVHMRYVENHDETRYLEECDRAALRAAVAATFTLPGAPMVYYGQERGMTDYRGPMRWHDGDLDLTAYHRELSALRDDLPALRRGRLTSVEWEADDDADSDAVVAYGRETGDQRVVVALNFGERPATVTLKIDNWSTLTVRHGDGSEQKYLEDGPQITVDSVAVLIVE